MSQYATPADWFKGFAQNWKSDLIAAVSVSLVALPLALGIAIAAGAPPMSGIISAIIGGVVTTFLRGSHVAINGPANSLIALVLVGMTALDDGSGQTFSYLLSAFIVSGAIQVVLGFLKLGRFAEAIPSSVIQGILAAIGIIIVAKQLHVALGTSSDADNMVGVLIDVFKNIPNANPFLVIISALGMLLLIFHNRISYKLFHFLPAPMWVLIISIPFVFLFGFFDEHAISFLGKEYVVGPQYLISIPDNPWDGILFPNFSKIGTGSFWLVVTSITLITTVETLASTKAVDKIDPYKRKTNLNRDLMAVGASTVVSGIVGGLPIVTVIVRSTVNVHNNGKTRWANFFHGLLLFAFIMVLAPVIKMIPLAALAVILVFSGYKLTAPRIYTHAYEQGMEQLLFLMGTLVITLYTNLLWGVIGGIVLTLGVHLLLARVPIQIFFTMIFKSGTKMFKKDDENYELRVKGVANFLSILTLNKYLDQVPQGANLKVNISTARLVDFTVLEHLEEYRRIHGSTGGKMHYVGLDHHVASTSHPLALKSQTSPLPQRLSPRQQELKKLAVDNDWTFRHEAEWQVYDLLRFHFFESRPIEYKENIITGAFKDESIEWEISDVTFDEGALMATEVYHTTIQVIHLPFEIPEFMVESEGLFDKIFDKVISLRGRRDIDFKEFNKFSNNMILSGPNEDAVRQFFTPELIQFFERNDNDEYHVESNRREILIFKKLRLARVKDIEAMLEFSEKLVNIIQPIEVEP